MTKRKVRIREVRRGRSTSSGWRMPLLRLAREQLADDELRAVPPEVRKPSMTDLFAFTIAIAFHRVGHHRRRVGAEGVDQDPSRTWPSGLRGRLPRTVTA